MFLCKLCPLPKSVWISVTENCTPESFKWTSSGTKLHQISSFPSTNFGSPKITHMKCNSHGASPTLLSPLVHINCLKTQDPQWACVWRRRPVCERLLTKKRMKVRVSWGGWKKAIIHKHKMKEGYICKAVHLNKTVPFYMALSNLLQISHPNVNKSFKQEELHYPILLMSLCEKQ